MSTQKIMAFVSVAIVAVLALVVVLSSMNHDSSSGTDIDGAFVTAMVPHHQKAIEMARLAQQKAEHPEIVNLANNIESSQSDEIVQMNKMRKRLSGSSNDGQDDGDMGMGGSTMGMSNSMMGMDMDMGALKSAKPFDKEFIDQMIPHHQGAIRMARMELSDGQDQETEDLAKNIIAAQSAEIIQMNAWRTKWYGAPSPAGGVPTDVPDMDPGMDSMSGMDH